MHAEVSRVIGFGVLQGITTFLPISSSGHLALAEMLFVPSGIGAAEQLALLTGTLVATVAASTPLLANMLRALTYRLRGRSGQGLASAEKDLCAILLAQAATAVCWLALGDARSELSTQPSVIAIGLGVTSLALVSTAWIGSRARLHATWEQALLIGAVQGIALLPGMSVLGCSVAAAMWMGLTARRSFELSLLMSVPSLAAAMAALMPRVASLPIQSATWVLGLSVAAVTGFGAAQLLRYVVIRERMAWFSIWVMPLSVATFAFARVWPVR